MPEKKAATPEAPLAEHGASILPHVVVDTYNAEIRDEDGFLGDRASNTAFRETLEAWRERLARLDEDPLAPNGKNGGKKRKGNKERLGKRKLDKLLEDGDYKSAGLLLSVIEDFAQELIAVLRRFLKLKAWQGTERILIGGGFSNSRIGELVIGRAQVVLTAEKIEADLVPIRHDPDEAGLLGSVHLAPSWIFSGHDALLAVDIGGTNIRAGVVETELKKKKDLSKASVWASELWRHGDEKPSRREAVERLVKMLRDLIREAEKSKLRLAPFIGVACPGLIERDGAIRRGGQNLPGNWEAKGFNLPQLLREAIPTIDDHPTAIVMHNDAVVQGLSELPFQQDVKRWGTLTVGTGLGNARFTNRKNTAKE